MSLCQSVCLCAHWPLLSDCSAALGQAMLALLLPSVSRRRACSPHCSPSLPAIALFPKGSKVSFEPATQDDAQSGMLLQLAVEASIPEACKFYCPHSRCSTLMVTEETGPNTSAECPACHRLLCLWCRIPWHAGQTCGEAMVRLTGLHAIIAADQLATTSVLLKCTGATCQTQHTHACTSSGIAPAVRSSWHNR